MAKSADTRRILLIGLLLIAATLAVFWRTLDNNFINYDDDNYVTANQHVQAGLTGESISWAFTSTVENNWHPLTWISHILDWQRYGQNPMGHHLTNLLFHIATVLLLFVVLYWMTKRVWRSAFVAALFAIHPLHVESVAWVAERKDVLSTFFWLLTMLAYVWYVERPKARRYILVVALFALGLMAKPMLVTLPFALLLLDYWPLKRLLAGRRHSWRGLILEKSPLFALSAASSVVTYFVQKGAVSSFDVLPLWMRVENAAVSYVTYIIKAIRPDNLAVIYPYPRHGLPIWEVVGAALLLVAISVVVLRCARRLPYLSVGWFWYLGTLVPVIGIVQVGLQAMADRYTYVPLIGIFIIIAWGVPDLLRSRGLSQSGYVAVPAAIIIIGALTAATWKQVGYWRDSVTLFKHALACTKDNYVAHSNLAAALVRRPGELDKAIAHCHAALRIQPDSAEAHFNLGNALSRQGKPNDAIAQYREALRANPGDPEVHNNLGAALTAQGRTEEAIIHYKKALRIRPDCAETHNNLGNALSMQGKSNWSAIESWQTCVGRWLHFLSRPPSGSSARPWIPGASMPCSMNFSLVSSLASSFCWKGLN